MWRRQTGMVVGKDFKPPPGSEPPDHCYLVVDITGDGELISLRLQPAQVDRFGVGDQIVFFPPSRPDKRVSWLRRI